jgi:hypothetical protein
LALFRDDDTPLDEPPYDRADTQMDDQLGGDQYRKSHQQSDLCLKVVEKWDAAGTTPPVAPKLREEQQGQPCDQYNDQDSAMQQLQGISRYMCSPEQLKQRTTQNQRKVR